MALMQKGLVKRIVIGSTRTFKIEVSDEEFNSAMNNDEQTATMAEAAPTTAVGDNNETK